MMKANGLDPNMMDEMSMGDPSQAITLYKASSDKNIRKIYLMKKVVSGYIFAIKMEIGNRVIQMTFSVKKIRSGYWELVIDKPLAKRRICFYHDGHGNERNGWQ